MERRLNQRFSCAIYALTEDPDYLMFDADLWEGRWIGGTVPSDYSAVALVVLSPGSVELVLEHEGFAYRLATDTGSYNAQQLVCGEAGASASIAWLPRVLDVDDADAEEAVADEDADAPPLVGAGDCEGCSRSDVELYQWGEMQICFDCTVLGRSGRWL